MKSFRVSLMLAALGGIAGPMLAQEAPANRSLGVTLGRPASAGQETPAEPIAYMRSFVPIKKANPSAVPPSVVRGARPIMEDELRTPLTPRDLAPARGSRFVQLPQPTLPEIVDKAEPAPQQAPAKNGAEKPEVIKAPVRILGNYETASDLTLVPKAASEGAILSETEAMGFLDPASDPEFYLRGEYLHWWARGFRVPPLATTASPNDPADTRGTLGVGTTRLLFGDTNVLEGLRSGARITLGWNCDPCGIYGIEASFFFLARKSESANFDSSDFPVIGRPFFFLNIGEPSRELTTTPEFNTGNLRIDMSTSLFGAEINKRALLWCGCDYKLTGMLGFRYLDLSDRLSFEENSNFINDVPAPASGAPLFSKGDRSFVFDRFETRNRFYGGQLGLEYETRRERWILEARAKIGLGATHQTIDIDGGQRITRANGNVDSFVGGLYALDSNIGRHSQTRFSVVPEVGFKVGYDVTSNVRVFAGYDFLYWSNVVRPGDQIDTTLDVNRVPNAGGPFPPANQVRPRVPFTTTNYWAHGFTGGLELRY
jgi:hypothetical protein